MKLSWNVSIRGDFALLQSFKETVFTCVKLLYWRVTASQLIKTAKRWCGLKTPSSKRPTTAISLNGCTACKSIRLWCFSRLQKGNQSVFSSFFFSFLGVIHVFLSFLSLLLAISLDTYSGYQTAIQSLWIISSVFSFSPLHTTSPCSLFSTSGLFTHCPSASSEFI